MRQLILELLGPAHNSEAHDCKIKIFPNGQNWSLFNDMGVLISSAIFLLCSIERLYLCIVTIERIIRDYHIADTDTDFTNTGLSLEISLSLKSPTAELFVHTLIGCRDSAFYRASHILTNFESAKEGFVGLRNVVFLE